MTEAFKLTRGILATKSLESNLCCFVYIFPFCVATSTRLMENKGWEQGLSGKESLKETSQFVYGFILSSRQSCISLDRI